MLLHPICIAIRAAHITGLAKGRGQMPCEVHEKKGEKESFEFHCAPGVVILKCMLATDLPLELLIPLSFAAVFILYID
jgi:hypothetical protein